MSSTRKVGSLFCRMRDKKVSYWVQMADNDAWNIWDLPVEQATPEVDKAIAAAFERGMVFASRAARRALDSCPSCDVDRSAMPAED